MKRIGGLFMKILALDFSSPQRSVAVGTTGAADVFEVVAASPGRDMKPFALIEAALRKAGLERETIECVAVGLGPGSYTGIRVAISVAQGWQLATGVKLLGLSTAECLAAQLAGPGGSGRFGVVIDAQRGEFYLAGYEHQNGAVRETAALRLASRNEVEAVAAAGDLLVGPEVTRWFPEGKNVYPQATTLVRLAQGRTDFVAGVELEPIYLREPTFVKAPPLRTLPGVR
jgi:tRNA threonylcarbamoyl adenosine modification protein YeaZ